MNACTSHMHTQGIAGDDVVEQPPSRGGRAPADHRVGPRRDAIDFEDETELAEDETPLQSRVQPAYM